MIDRGFVLSQPDRPAHHGCRVMREVRGAAIVTEESNIPLLSVLVRCVCPACQQWHLVYVPLYLALAVREIIAIDGQGDGWQVTCGQCSLADVHRALHPGRAGRR